MSQEETDFGERLTEEEAQELYNNLGVLEEEINDQLRHGDVFDPEETDYVVLVRRKFRKYLQDVYDVDGSEK